MRTARFLLLPLAPLLSPIRPASLEALDTLGGAVRDPVPPEVPIAFSRLAGVTGHGTRVPLAVKRRVSGGGS
jgi:hypothetical protein